MGAERPAPSRPQVATPGVNRLRRRFSDRRSGCRSSKAGVCAQRKRVSATRCRRRQGSSVVELGREPLMDRAVGIDLGTTFSAVAWVNPDTGRAEVLADPDTQERTTPSVVMFDDDASVIVGRFAKDNAIAEPQKVVEFVKRQMGKDARGDPPDGFQFRSGDHSYSAQEISALILKRLKTIAENRLGG